MQLQFQQIHQALTDQNSENLVTRIYTEQNINRTRNFQFTWKNPEQTNSIINQPIKQLFLTQIINECTVEVLVMNNKIFKGVKLSMSILENGKGICDRKKEYLKIFFQNQQLDQVLNQQRVAFHQTSPARRSLIVYRMMAISNLILKFAINISKISILVFVKPVLHRTLSTITLSLVFLQLLDYQLVKGKKIAEQIDFSFYLNSIPRITVIKLCQQRNAQDRKLLERSHKKLFYSSKKMIKNIQYIELYLEQDPFSWDNQYQKNYTKQGEYEHIHSINLSKKLGLSTLPLPFELVHFYEEYLIPLINDFEPSVLVINEDFPGDSYVMDPAMRGMIITKIVQKVTAKIYFIRQISQLNQKQIKIQSEKNNSEIVEQSFGLDSQLKQRLTKLDAFWTRVEQYNKLKIGQMQCFQKLRRYLIDDLSYIAIALIHKMPLSRVQSKYRASKFSLEFVKGLHDLQHAIYDRQHVRAKLRQIQTMMKMGINRSGELIRQLQMQENSSLQTIYFQADSNSEQQQNNFQSEIFKQLQGCSNFTNKIIQIKSQRSTYSTIYNIRNYNYQVLQVPIQSSQKFQIFSYESTDQLYVKYMENMLLVFILKINQYSILKKPYENQEHFTCLVNKNKYPNDWQPVTNSILVASDNFLYRGFGALVDSKTGELSQKIFKHYLLPQNSKGIKNVYQWKQCKFQVIPSEYMKNIQKSSQVNQKKTFQLERKHSGFGFFDKELKNVYFIGGYLQSKNQQKISKTICIVNDVFERQKIHMLGKTNRKFQNYQRYKKDALKRYSLFPFIFGMPFVFSKNGNNVAYIINTNGFYQKLNNSQELFMTQMSLSKNILQNAIVEQTKQPQFKQFKACIAQKKLKKQVILSYFNKKDLEIDRLYTPYCFEDYKMLGQKLIQLLVQGSSQVNQYQSQRQHQYYVQTSEGKYLIRMILTQEKEQKPGKVVQVIDLDRYQKSIKQKKYQMQMNIEEVPDRKFGFQLYFY